MAYKIVGKRNNTNMSIVWNDSTDADYGGTLISENVVKDANLMPFPLFTLDSDDTEVFDFGGAIRIITIQASHNDTTTNLATFSQNKLMPLISGDQENTSTDGNLTYTSTILGTVSVKIMHVDQDKPPGEPRKLVYTIKMVESA